MIAKSTVETVETFLDFHYARILCQILQTIYVFIKKSIIYFLSNLYYIIRRETKSQFNLASHSVEKYL